MTKSHVVRASCILAILGGLLWTACFSLNFPLKDRGPEVLPEAVLGVLVSLSLAAFAAGLAGVAWVHRDKLAPLGRLAALLVALALLGALAGGLLEGHDGLRREGTAWLFGLGSLYLLFPLAFALLGLAILRHRLLPRWAALTPLVTAALFALLWVVALTGGFWGTWILFATATLSLGPAWIVLACGTWSTTRAAVDRPV
jgi:hypothetical protein